MELNITYDILSQHFNLPISQAAINLGTTRQNIRKKYLEFGLDHWPYQDQKYKNITYDMIAQHFNSTIKEAARALNISEHCLRKKYKELGINKWPSHSIKHTANIEEITYDVVAQYFNLSITDAAYKLGINEKTLTKIYRKFGLDCWPYRNQKYKNITHDTIAKYFNLTQIEAAHKLGINENTLRKKCKELKISRWHNKYTKYYITYDMIAQYFDLTQTEAARKLGINENTLRIKCNEFGISRWPSHSIHHITNNDEITYDMIAQYFNLTITDAACKLGTNRKKLREIYSAFGLDCWPYKDIKNFLVLSNINIKSYETNTVSHNQIKPPHLERLVAQKKSNSYRNIKLDISLLKFFILKFESSPFI